VKGCKLRIGLAVSQDGFYWSRVEGDLPSGAIIEAADVKDAQDQDRVRPCCSRSRSSSYYTEMVVLMLMVAVDAHHR